MTSIAATASCEAAAVAAAILLAAVASLAQIMLRRGVERIQIALNVMERVSQ